MEAQPASLHQKTYSAHHDASAARIAVSLEEQRHFEKLKKERNLHDFAFLAGRVLVGLVFLTTAAVKLLTYPEMVAALDAREMAAPGFLVSTAIVVELCGGLLLLGGLFTRRAAMGLVLWLGTVTVFMHSNLAVDVNRSFALANLAIAGGLLAFVAVGGGSYSLDTARTRQELKKEMT